MLEFLVVTEIAVPLIGTALIFFGFIPLSKGD